MQKTIFCYAYVAKSYDLPACLLVYWSTSSIGLSIQRQDTICFFLFFGDKATAFSACMVR